MSISFRIPDAADGSQRTCFYQHDRGQRIYIDGATVSDDGTAVLFPEALLVTARGLDTVVQTLTAIDTDGNVYAVIPDAILDEGTKLYVYAYDLDSQTGRQEVIASASFQVKQRGQIVEEPITTDEWSTLNQDLATATAAVQTTGENATAAQAAADAAEAAIVTINDIVSGLENLETVLANL